jgi:hypothetical protein
MVSKHSLPSVRQASLVNAEPAVEINIVNCYILLKSMKKCYCVIYVYKFTIASDIRKNAPEKVQLILLT